MSGQTMGIHPFNCSPASLAKQCVIAISRAGIEIVESHNDNEITWVVPGDDDHNRPLQDKLAFEMIEREEWRPISREWLCWQVFARDGNLGRVISNILLASGGKTDYQGLWKHIYHCAYREAIHWPTTLTNRELGLTTETCHYTGNNINTTEFPAGKVHCQGVDFWIQSGPCIDLESSELQYFVSVMYPLRLWRTRRYSDRLEKVASSLVGLAERHEWTTVDFKLEKTKGSEKGTS